jgi:hypothetical protein
MLCILIESKLNIKNGEMHHIVIRKAHLRTRFASVCAHFDYRPDCSTILRFLMVILSPSRQT